jgi:hypothetical protein
LEQNKDRPTREELAIAIISIMDGTSIDDLIAVTGLQEARCLEIKQLYHELLKELMSITTNLKVRGL